MKTSAGSTEISIRESACAADRREQASDLVFPAIDGYFCSKSLIPPCWAIIPRCEEFLESERRTLNMTPREFEVAVLLIARRLEVLIASTTNVQRLVTAASSSRVSGLDADFLA